MIMKKVFSILVVSLFVLSLTAQQSPKKNEQTKPAEKAKTEVKACCKDKAGNKDSKTCCSKAKSECKEAKKDSTKCTAKKK
jgi:hypothetical protein